MGVNYTPDFVSYTGQGAFKYWCQTVLPLVYDDSLSYYELLNKVVHYLNNVISDVSATETNVESLRTAYNQLQQYVNDYFDNLDVQNEINEKLDAMASDGSLSLIIDPLVSASTTAWLNENITPTTPLVDASLSVAGAAADAYAVGTTAILVGGHITQDNYSNYFTNANDAPINKIYSIQAAITEAMISNLPKYNLPTQAILVTLCGRKSADGTINAFQIFAIANGGKIYSRSSNLSRTSWSSWVELLTENDITRTVSIGGYITANNYSSYFTNANDAPINKIYGIQAVIEESMIANLPAYNMPTQANLITLCGREASNGNMNAIQIFAIGNGGKIYTRSSNLSRTSWSSWIEMLSSDNLNSILNTGVNIHSANYSTYFNDANNAPRNRSFTIIGDITPEMISNLPVYNLNGLLFTLDGNGLGTNVLLQTYATSKDVYFRTCNYEQNWQEWKKVATQVKTYYVGANREYTSFTQCIWDLKDDTSEKIIYVDGGVYDIYQEYINAGIPVIPDDGDFNSGYTPYNAWIPENTHVIGRGNVTLKYSPSPSDVSSAESKTVSPLNIHSSCTVENITVECKNGRYCAHIDGQGASKYSDSRIKLKNVHFVKHINDEELGWTNAIGIGLDRQQNIEFEDCIFESENVGFSNFYAHNRGVVGDSNLTANESSGMTIKNCVFIAPNGSDNIVLLQSRTTTNLLKINVRFINSIINGSLRLGANATGVTNCFNVSLFRCDNPTIVIDDPNNPYPVEIYS